MAKTIISKAYDILKEYSGKNNQINYYKTLYENKKLVLDDFSSQYITKNVDYEPIEVNKVVKITEETGQYLSEKLGLDIIPDKVYISTVIGEMGGSYHCYIRSKAVGTKLIYLKKRGILDKLVDIDYMSLNLDFDKFDNMPSNQGRKLKEHQKIGAKFLVANKKAILADSMGLGKTTTSIIAALAGGYKNILIITTASLKSGWKKDLVLYEDEKNINIVSGSNWTPGSKFTVINYDIIQNFYEVPMEPVFEYNDVYDQFGNVVETLKTPVMIKDKSTGKMVQKMQKSKKKKDVIESLNNSPLFLQNYDCVIIDEAQKLSNKSSGRYMAISDFLVKSNPKAIYLLTGTPLTNNPMNLYNILKLINAEITWDYKYYVTRYCGGREMHLKDGRTILITKEATHLDELREKIKDVYIRRLASETGEMVGKNIVRKYYDFTESQKKEYEKLWEEYQNAQTEEKREDNESYRQLIEGSLVRQFLSKAMVKNTIDMADEYIENGEKVVIITCFQEEMDMLQKHFGKKCVVYNGSMLPKQKDKAQDEFMNNPNIMVFIGQVISCGVGLSLPISRTLIFNSFDFVAANNMQAEDRIYRLTQKRDVECIYQLFNNSWAQEMFDKVIYKEMLMKSLINSENEKSELK